MCLGGLDVDEDAAVYDWWVCWSVEEINELVCWRLYRDGVCQYLNGAQHPFKCAGSTAARCSQS